MSSRAVYVDPSRLLVVTYEDNDGDEHDVLAVTARYVPATLASNRRRVVMQLIFDRVQKDPGGPYYCPRARLQSRLVAPHRIVGIRPYVRES